MKKLTYIAERDAAFPTPCDASKASSTESSKNSEDSCPPMCGLATLNKVLAVGSPKGGAKSAAERKSLPPIAVVKVPSSDDIDEHSILDTKGGGSTMSSVSLNTVKQSNGRPPTSPRVRSPGNKTKKKSSSKENEKIRSIIMEQHDLICRLGSENKQFKESMALSQKKVTRLEKQQADQTDELNKLHLERDSLEVEAASLRDELETMKLQLLVKKFSERGPLSAKELMSGNHQEESKHQSMSPPVSFVRFHSAPEPALEQEPEPVAGCTDDLQELQAKGLEFYELVSTFSLEAPKLAAKSSGGDEEATRGRQRNRNS